MELDDDHGHYAYLDVEFCPACGAVTGLKNMRTGESVSTFTAHMDWHAKMGSTLIDIFTAKKPGFWCGRALRRIARG